MPTGIQADSAEPRGGQQMRGIGPGMTGLSTTVEQNDHRRIGLTKAGARKTTPSGEAISSGACVNSLNGACLIRPCAMSFIQ